MEEKKKSSDKGSVAAGAGTAIGGGLLLVTNLKKGKKASKGQLKKTGKNFYLILNNLKGKKASRKANLNTVNRSAGGDWYHSRAYSELENTDNISMENYYDEQERLFSTGDEELDDILEEVYYSGIEDGYDYAYEEREYAEDSDSDNKGKGAGTAVAGLGAGTVAAGRYGAKKAQAKAEKEGAAMVDAAIKKGKIAKEAVDQAYMEGRTKTSGVISTIINELKRRKGAKAANKYAEELESGALKDARKVLAKGDKKAAQIAKRSAIAGGALLVGGGLLSAASGLKKGDKKENNQQKNYSDMEIRRKVFSLLEDENGEERYYSTTEFEMDYDWETGEKYFSEKKDDDNNKKKGMSKGGKIALGVTGAAAASVAALEGANMLKKGVSYAKAKKLAKTSMTELLEKAGKKNGGEVTIDMHAAIAGKRNKAIAAAEKGWRGQEGIGFVERANKGVADFAGRSKNYVVSKYKSVRDRLAARKAAKKA